MMSSSPFSSTTSRSGNGGLSSGLEFVNRMSMSLHIALTASSTTTIRHLAFSPFRFAIISSNSSVYCMTCSVTAVRLYVPLFW